MTDRNFGGVIWTNHALARLNERGIKQGDAWATFQRPEQSRYAAAQGAWVYHRTYPSAGTSAMSSVPNGSGQAQKIEVVAKKNEKGQWIILSVWSRPVYGQNIKKPDSLLKLIFKRIFKK